MAIDTPFRITPALDILLRGTESLPVGLFHLHVATAEQLCRLHHAMGSKKFVKAKLRILEDHGFIQHDELPTKRVRSEYHYMMDKAGMEYLWELGMHRDRSFRTAKEVHTNSQFIIHSLEINDVLISAAMLHKAAPACYLHGFMHERVFKRSPCSFSWQDKSDRVIPDAFLEFRRSMPGGSERRLPLLLEHDRGTEYQQAFREHIRAYIGFLRSGAYKERFATERITIVFTTFKGEYRRDQMREWTKAELKWMGESEDIGFNFVFAATANPPEPIKLWLEPCWYTPYSDQPISLLGV